MVLFFLLLITPSAAFKQYSHGLRRHSEPPRAVSTGGISEERALAAIRAAPIERRNNAAYDLAERLMLAPMFSRGAWREAFRSLITADAFVRYGWASRPFKLEEDWGFAVGAYTMADVERACSSPLSLRSTTRCTGQRGAAHTRHAAPQH